MSQQPEAGAADKVLSALKEPDRFVQETIAAARAGLDRCVADANDYVRTAPVKALATAAVAGFALRILPVTRIVNTLLHVTLALLKPAMLVYGGAKVWQKLHGETAPDRAPISANDPTGDASEKKQSAAGQGSGN